MEDRIISFCIYHQRFPKFLLDGYGIGPAVAVRARGLSDLGGNFNLFLA